MRIAILGTRGIPNNYGGFEKLAERLSAGLSENGHQVFVYNSHNHPYRQKKWGNVNIIHRFDPEKMLGSAGQFVYDLNCIRNARKQDFDIILNLGYTSSAVWMKLFPPRPVLITNMDGFEWKRSKFNSLVRLFLKYSERLAVKHSDVLVADSLFIQNFLFEKYKVKPAFIAYGADLFNTPDENTLSQFGVSPYAYNLLVARMEPENNIEMILDGVVASAGKLPFLVVGQTNNQYAKSLIRKYRNEPRIIFAGTIFESTLINNLRHYSSIYFHGHSVGGTNPSLLEAMGCRCFILAHNNIFNKKVLGSDALYFESSGDVAGLITSVDRWSQTSQTWIGRNYEKIRESYSWPAIIRDYEELMLQQVESKLSQSRVVT